MAIITDDITWTGQSVTVWVTTEGTEPVPSEEDAVRYAEAQYGYPYMQADEYAHGWAVRFERVYE